MVIWLRHHHRAATGPNVKPDAAQLGVNADVIPRAALGDLLTLEQAYDALADERACVLAEAHAQADAVIAAAEQAAAERLEAAQHEYDGALARGHADGLDRARTEWMEQMALSAVTQTQLQQRMRTRLAEIVCAAVEQIVNFQDRQALFERALTTVERIVKGATYLRVTVHPEDLERANETFTQLAERWRELGYPVSLAVTADQQLPSGSCLCESDFGKVDAGLDTQLRAMRNAISRVVERTINGSASRDENENETERQVSASDGDVDAESADARLSSEPTLLDDEVDPNGVAE